MTGEHIKQLLQRYYDHYEGLWPKLPPRQIDANYGDYLAASLTTVQKTAHYKFMCLEAQKFVDQGRMEKAHRWLGFLQGVLFKKDYYSINDLRIQSQPIEEKDEQQ